MIKQPEGDIWALRNDDENTLDFGKTFICDFTGFAREDLKSLLKDYVWHEYRARNKGLHTLCKNVRVIKKTLNWYMVINEIESVRMFRVEDAEKFQAFLKLSLNEKGRPYKQSTIATSYSAFRGVILYGQSHKKHLVPEVNIFPGSQQISRNRKPRIDYVPDEVMVKINAVLPKVENVYIRNAVTIFKYTGMRMGELSSLKRDCLKEHLINGYMMQWMDFKNRKERNPVPVHLECAEAVLELLDYTKEMRLRAPKPDQEYLFIRETKYGVGRIERGMIGKWLKSIPEDYNIRGSDGEIYRLASHQFRRTLATDMFSNGVNIKVIQETLGHSSITTTTKYYTDVKDKQRIAMFKNIGIIGNIRTIDESIIADAEELKWFRANMDTAARMCDGYCTSPVRSGEICDRLLKRQKCLTCSRFITTPEYLEAHRQHLSELEKELELNTFGDHYAEHLIPTVEALREIIQRLEEVADGEAEI